LGEWFGYVISGRTDLHKIFMMVGPTRGGKGVIARILTALLGKRNVCGPTLSSLGGEFGLGPLLGKSLAVISDARSVGVKGASSVVVERLLSISGEDTLTVNRKYREQWTGRLSTRLHIVSNELPRLGDASSAIIGRLVLLLTTRSWLGNEDHELEVELHKELSGILNFALDGLRRLTVDNENRFTRFDDADEAITQMRDLASPVGAFVREGCILDSKAEVPVDDLYAAYKLWCEAGEYPKSSKAHFGRDLRAACPSVRKTRPRNPNPKKPRDYVYAGIRRRTKEDDEAEAKAAAASSTGHNALFTRTTRTNHQGETSSGPGNEAADAPANPLKSKTGPSGPSKKPILGERSPHAPKPRSNDPPDDGLVVETPDLGPDPLDAHGATIAQANGQGSEAPTPNVPPGRIRELADWCLGQAADQNAASATGDVNRAKIEDDLRLILREETTSPEEAEAAFTKVMAQLFAV
jgi:putative DNA primase/helicase